MSSEIAIACQGISKSYNLYTSSADRLLSAVFPSRTKRSFTALQSLDLTIKRGEFFGIIGKNGSGKSTLLQIISGIIPPTQGHMQVAGRVGAMLELGAGFNPEFTGRENARLNAQILGLSRAEIEASLPSIEEFADIGDFIDQPVMTYSSGMYVRLAFAVQTAINPDILIIDEALAVGDIFFRMKCYDRLNKLKAKGTTVILVTHSAEDITFYCDRALLLDHGKSIFCGDPTEAVNRYYELGQIAAPVAPEPENDGEHAEDCTEIASDEIFRTKWPVGGFLAVDAEHQTGDGKAVCLGLRMQDEAGVAKQVFYRGDTLQLFIEYRAETDIGSPCGGFVIRTDKGIIVHGRHSAQTGAPVPRLVRAQSVVSILHEIVLDLAVGEYVIDLGFSSFPSSVYAKRDSLTAMELEGLAVRHNVITNALHFSVVARVGGGYRAQPFYGLAGLRSTSLLARLNDHRDDD